MAQKRKLSALAGSAVIPGIALAALLAISGYAFLGPTGILAWSEYNVRLVEQRAELAELRADRLALENRIRLLRDGSDGGDYKGELIRRELGMVAPDELIVPLR